MSPLSRRSLLASFASVVVLSGCEMTPPQNNFAAIGFSHLQPLVLQVNRVEIQQDYEMPRQAPHVGHRFPDPLPDVAERWGRQRLKAAGGEAQARFRILEASVIQEELPTTQGLKRFFVIDQSERYDGRLRVELEISDRLSGQTKTVRADVRRSVTVPEDASLTEREAIWFQLTEDLMRRFDREMEQAMRENLGEWLQS